MKIIDFSWYLMIILVPLTYISEEPFFIVLNEESLFYCLATEAVNILTL